MKTGILGCGNISNAYFKGAARYPQHLQLVACADLNPAAAEAKAAEHKVAACSIDEMLRDPSIDLVINLTTPAAHLKVSAAILKAGKHAYSEKPFAATLDEGKKLLKAWQASGKRLGCAPDTFLGCGHQTARKVIDNGWIGTPINGTAFMQCPGHESWHPNPAFYYQQGGGPMLDMGPYYVTDLVQLLGPVRRVTGAATRGFAERVCTSEARNGEKIPVVAPTHVAGLLEFAGGALITLVTSFDVIKHDLPNIQIHGTEGSLAVPDPNSFEKPVFLATRSDREWRQVPFCNGLTQNLRGVGAADLAAAEASGRPHRCAAELAFHVLEVMTAFERSYASGKWIDIQSTCERPAPLPYGLRIGDLD